MMRGGASAAPAKWWQWQPAGAFQTVVYLALMALFSGVLSILIDRLVVGSATSRDFVSGAILGLVINAITLWMKRHPRHPRPHGS